MRVRLLEGRGAIITGASRGLGLAIAEAYVHAGASVMMCARHQSELEASRARLEKRAEPDQVVAAEVADVSVEEQSTRLVDRAAKLLPTLQILVNNAGVLGPIGAAEGVSWPQWQRAVEINLFGSVLVSRAVVPHFRREGYGKIVQISGGGATSPDPRFSAYAASKAAIVRYTETLAAELRAERIDANALSPGPLNTEMTLEKIAAGPAKLGAELWARALRQGDRDPGALTHAADLAVFLGSAASDGLTGKLISAVWDDWRSFASRIDELQASDAYTLRRVLPEDVYPPREPTGSW